MQILYILHVHVHQRNKIHFCTTVNFCLKCYNLLTLCHLLRYKRNNANIMKSSTRYESYTDGDDFINTSSDEFILILQ